MNDHDLADFTAVIVGGDTGAYSLARAFYEQYGIRPFVISQYQTWIVKYSKILRHVQCDDAADPEQLAATLRAEPIATETDGRPVLLIGSTDPSVQAIIRLAGHLPEGFIAPYVDQARFDRATIKQNFTEVCQKLGLDHPDTKVLDLAEVPDGDVTVPFEFPIMVKPADVTAWEHVSFDGKKKVHTAHSAAELALLVRTMYDAGYRKNAILQDMVPGNDQGMRTLTCYCDVNSDVRYASWGVTLLEENSPGAVGNPVAMVTSHDYDTVEQSRKLLKELEWVGYANFDLKYDPRDSTMKFIELNPRLGRSNFYIIGGGHNPATYYVDEYVYKTLRDQPDIVQEQQETCYTIVPKRLLLRYVTDPAMKSWVRGIFRRGGGRNPFFNPAETDPRRWALVAAAQLSYVKKFFQHHPVT